LRLRNEDGPFPPQTVPVSLGRVDFRSGPQIQVHVEQVSLRRDPLDLLSLRKDAACARDIPLHDFQTLATQGAGLSVISRVLIEQAQIVEAHGIRRSVGPDDFLPGRERASVVSFGLIKISQLLVEHA
jgi:hypothetical protein